jgi:hypothetical protein
MLSSQNVEAIARQRPERKTSSIIRDLELDGEDVETKVAVRAVRMTLQSVPLTRDGSMTDHNWKKVAGYIIAQRGVNQPENVNASARDLFQGLVVENTSLRTVAERNNMSEDTVQHFGVLMNQGVLAATTEASLHVLLNDMQMHINASRIGYPWFFRTVILFILFTIMTNWTLWVSCNCRAVFAMFLNFLADLVMRVYSNFTAVFATLLTFTADFVMVGCFNLRAVFATLLQFSADLLMRVYSNFTAVFTTLFTFTADFVMGNLRAVFAMLLKFTADLVMGIYFIYTAVFTTFSDFIVDLFPPIVSALAVLVGLTGFFLVKVIRGRQLQKEELLLDIVVCRGRVWDILARDFREEHQSVHIRDQICLQIYPISQSGRKYIQSTVWPRVVGDIRQDTRIRKRDVAVAAAAGGGAVEMREYWQWVAVPRHV